LVGVAGI